MAQLKMPSNDPQDGVFIGKDMVFVSSWFKESAHLYQSTLTFENWFSFFHVLLWVYKALKATMVLNKGPFVTELNLMLRISKKMKLKPH